MRLKLYSVFTAAVGTLIGAGSCAYKAIAEYGMPYATYKVSGHVEDQNGDPIRGIEVVLGDRAYSDANGAWSIESSGPSCHSSCTVQATDVDGADNGGLYESKTVDITLLQTDPGSESPEDGTWEAHDVVIQLDLASSGTGGAGEGGAGGSGGAGGGAGGT